jgi:flagellar operon protein
MSNESQMLRMLEPSVRPMGSPAPAVRPQKPVEQKSFSELLESAEKGFGAGLDRPLKLSGHAQQRLAEGGVELSDAQMGALASAATKAEAKGARDTLMLMDNMGLIVNIPNRTVVTVMPEERMQSGVVTQIDSTVLVKS